MPNAIKYGHEFLKELEAEAEATRKCIERIPESLYSWKPHEKSMAMGYLVLLVAEIPKWISHMVTAADIDFALFPHFQAKTTAEMVAHFDDNMIEARKALENATNDSLTESFSLKDNGHVIMTMPKMANIGPTINHWVHHRGQLTIYMRLNNITVPSIYGPSADEQGF